MGSEYATNVKHFVTHDDVNPRESFDASALLLVVGLAAAVTAATAALAWWRRRA